MSEGLSREEWIVLERARRRLEEGPWRLDSIILFGSRALRTHKPWSDYDLLILADFREPYLERIGRVMEVLGDDLASVEPHPYTTGEALDMLRKGNPTIVHALEYGVVVKEGPGLVLLRRVYQGLKEKGMRIEGRAVVVPHEGDG